MRLATCSAADEVIDEYSAPKKGSRGADLWGYMAGISFTEEGMVLSFFHSGTVMVVDWRDGIDTHSRGVGSNKPFDDDKSFKIDKKKNRAKVTRVIDFVGGPADNPHRRRSKECLRGEAPGATPNNTGTVCNPGVFRQRVSIDIATLDRDDTENNHDEDATLALDPGMNVIAGIRINRMSAPACDYIQANEGAANEDCNVETLYVAASAVNPGCANTGGNAANPCFTPEGRVVEYRIDTAHLDGGSAWGGVPCDADPNSPTAGAGCALPVAEFGVLLTAMKILIHVC